jgi:hypothetical protein
MEQGLKSPVIRFVSLPNKSGTVGMEVLRLKYSISSLRRDFPVIDKTNFKTCSKESFLSLVKSLPGFFTNVSGRADIH